MGIGSGCVIVGDDRSQSMETVQSFGKYKVLRMLGGGGMANVYLAVDPNGAQVALKVPHGHFASDQEFRRRLRSEKDALCRLNHPCIALFKDFHDDSDPPILVMEYVEGPSLAQVLNETVGPWPTERACNILIQIAEALAYCHKAGIIHRDIKPANILLTGADHVKVTDFGISRLKDVPSLTQAGAIVGSGYIMAPEQWRAEPLTPKVDIYALGVIAYRMLTGRYPFDGEVSELYRAHCQDQPAAPRTLNPDLALPLSELVMLCLNKDARLRLSGADEFISRLARIRPQLDIYERYRFEEEIGRGSMGIVFRATRRNDGMKVAIKTLDQRLTDESLLKRLQTEATILARLNHRFICKMIETKENFLVMEFVSGEPLSDHIRRTSGLPLSKAVLYFKDILEAVGAAHREHVIHRDLKPSNVMITDDPIARHAIVMDFGIAKLLGSSGMTRTAEGVGAVPYKAPELWERQAPDQRSDIYSLGALLYEMLTSRYPFPGPEVEDFREQHLKRPPEPLPAEISDSNPRLAGLLMKCLEKNPKKRFASVDELYAEISNLTLIQGAQSGPGLESASDEFAPTMVGPAPAWPAPARRRHVVWWGAGAILAIVAFVVWQLMPKDKSQSSLTAGAEVQDTSASGSATVAYDAPTAVRDDQVVIAGRENESVAGSAPGTEISETAVPAPDEASVESVPGLANASDHGVETPAEVLLQVRPTPNEGTRCIIDGHDYDSQRDVRLPAGSHRVVLIHPDYPILERTVGLAASDTTAEYDLRALFTDRQSFDLRMALNPPSQDYYLELSLNGRWNRYSSFPVRDLTLLAGKWKFDARLRSVPGHNAAKATVDSCVTFPYGGGPRIRVMNTKGEIDLGTSEWSGIQVIPIQVFWSRP